MRNIGREVFITDNLETYLKYKGLLGDFIAFIKKIPRTSGWLDQPLSSITILTSASIEVSEAYQSIPETNKFKHLTTGGVDHLHSECSWIVAGLDLDEVNPPMNKYIRKFNSSKPDNGTNVSRAHMYYVRTLVLGQGNNTPHWFSAAPKTPNPNKFKEVI